MQMPSQGSRNATRQWRYKRLLSQLWALIFPNLVGRKQLEGPGKRSSPITVWLCLIFAIRSALSTSKLLDEAVQGGPRAKSQRTAFWAYYDGRWQSTRIYIVTGVLHHTFHRCSPSPTHHERRRENEPRSRKGRARRLCRYSGLCVCGYNTLHTYPTNAVARYHFDAADLDRVQRHLKQRHVQMYG